MLTPSFLNETCCRYPSWNFLEERISRERVIAIDSDSCKTLRYRYAVLMFTCFAWISSISSFLMSEKTVWRRLSFGSRLRRASKSPVALSSRKSPMQSSRASLCGLKSSMYFSGRGVKLLSTCS